MRTIIILLFLTLPAFPQMLQGIVGGKAPATATSYSDDFNRSNADPIGGNWSTSTGSIAMKIVSNEAASSGISSLSYWSANTFPDNQFAQVKISTLEDGGPAVRVSASAKTYYALEVWSAGARIRKVVNGTETNLGANFAITPSAGDVFRIEASGTTLTAYRNGSSLGSRTDSDIASGYAGICSYGSANRFDDWSGGAL